MKFNLKQEIPLIAIMAIPFIYLAYLWNALPEKIPIHWNIKGEIDGWGTKDKLIVILLTLTVFVYLLLQVVSRIDPKGKLEKMGNKLYHIKFFTMLVMSLLAVFILYSVQNQTGSNTKALFALMGFLFVGFGNYFQTLKPNYFIGIKTPWTLENETVWKETHKLGGKLWFFGGAVLTTLVLVLPISYGFTVFMLGIGILVIVPVVFSYLRFKDLKKLDL
jgi:uncharacterized membrane protein